MCGRSNSPILPLSLSLIGHVASVDIKQHVFLSLTIYIQEFISVSLPTVYSKIKSLSPCSIKLRTLEIGLSLFVLFCGCTYKLVLPNTHYVQNAIWDEWVMYILHIHPFHFSIEFLSILSLYPPFVPCVCVYFFDQKRGDNCLTVHIQDLRLFYDLNLSAHSMFESYVLLAVLKLTLEIGFPLFSFLSLYV